MLSHLDELHGVCFFDFKAATRGGDEKFACNSHWCRYALTPTAAAIVSEPRTTTWPEGAEGDTSKA